jgi:hypothetical protein
LSEDVFAPLVRVAAGDYDAIFPDEAAPGSVVDAGAARRKVEEAAQDAAPGVGQPG